MASNGFARRATVQRARLRAALCGLSKSGKTFDSLVIARELIKTLADEKCLKGNGKVGLIDSECGRSDDYGETFEFYTHDLMCFSPEAYIDALDNMVKEGYSVIIIDQISHEWAGSGGLLELTNNVAQQSSSKNSFTAFAQTTPRHNKFIESLVRCPTHLICTMRVKQDWELERNEHGKLEPRKLGMAPIQRESTDYEFDIVGNIDSNHYMKVETRGTLSRLLGNRVFNPGSDIDHPGDIVEIGQLVGKWIAGRASAEELGLISREQIDEIQGYADKLGWTYDHWKKFLSHHKIPSLSRMTPDIYNTERTNMIAGISRLESAKKASASQKV